MKYQHLATLHKGKSSVQTNIWTTKIVKQMFAGLDFSCGPF